MEQKLTKTGKVRKETVRTKETNDKRERYFLVVKLAEELNESKRELIELWTRNAGFLVHKLCLEFGAEQTEFKAYEYKNDKSFAAHPNVPFSLRRANAVKSRNAADMLAMYLEKHWSQIESSDLMPKQYFRRFKTV